MELRKWLKDVSDMGELLEVKGAHWNLEMGAIVDMIYRKSQATKPCISFSQIPDYPDNYRVVSGLLGSPNRVALTVGVKYDGNMMELVRKFRTLFKDVKPVPFKKVESGPLMENVLDETKLDMSKFPLPFHHELDGGRFFGTEDMVITRDPELGTVNIGTYRIQYHDPKTLALHILPGKHGAIHLNKAFQSNKPFPVAVATGMDPLLFMISCVEMPYGMCEYDYVGGLRGEPVPVIEGTVTGLPLPADAEIVIEGICYPGETRLEGPFGEWSGYYANNGVKPVEEPVIHVKRVLHRNNPILTMAQPGRRDETCFHRTIFRSALIWDELEKVGIPDVQGVWCNESGSTRFITVVSIKQRYGGHARQAGNIATMCHAGAFNGRYVIVVDEDIDPSNTFDVLWAMGTRSDPANDIEILRRCWSSSADPMMNPDTPPHEKRMNSRAIIDACKPFEWKDRFPPVVETSPELDKVIHSKFPEVCSSYGI